MRTKLVTRAGNGRAATWMVVLEPGEEAMAALATFAREHDVRGATFTGLGAVSDSTIAFFDRERQAYDEIRVPEQLEVLSLIGNIGVFEGEPRVHAHVQLGDPQGGVRGGHLVRATVWPTLEITVDVHDEALLREVDAESTLPLLVP